MRFKNFTQAYFLIKNNACYAKSLGDRAQGAILGAVIGFLVFEGYIHTRLPARESI